MNEKEFFKPFRKYELDYKRLIRWYLASLYSYNSTAKIIEQDIIEQNLPLKKLNKIYYKESHLIENNPHTLKRKYKKAYVDFLEEMTLIRIISILENFLLDVIRTSFYHDKTCFYEPKKTIEFQVSEFLSKGMEELEESFIEEKIGNLHRQGFNEVKKYYKKIFNIDFNNFNTSIESINYSVKHIHKIHDTRHLIIHRLGRTDEKFNKEYNFTGKIITLSEEDVILYLQIIDDFVEFLKNKFAEKWF
ncbi:hypothetical protein [Bacillus thuringiensis]|uniref:hypothetical protein n=1 Tax=Bacillus thuringiensis TaxID=1428 RepID=UPI001EDD34B6|nr:hypothetical protein [Bacillus thuringiensis]MCG3425553.1 hypothetical protein [Bacillus thuringiensis]